MMPDPLSTHLPNPLQRRAARWFGRRPCRIQLESPVISFTFDDFPRSALTNGGAILRRYGFSGTYYASFGLMDQETSTGEMFRCEDLQELIRQGHELACHTFDHCDSWQTTPDEFEASILRNRQAAAQHVPGLTLKSLSYPISWQRPATKRRIASFFQCARGGGRSVLQAPEAPRDSSPRAPAGGADARDRSPRSDTYAPCGSRPRRSQ